MGLVNGAGKVRRVQHTSYDNDEDKTGASGQPDVTLLHASFFLSLLLENLLQGCFNKIGWDRETDTVGSCIGLAIHCCQCWDANKLSLQIDQGPATIARIHSSIGLDSIGDRGSC